MLPLLQKASTRKSGMMSVSRSAVLNISSMAGSITRTGVEFPQDLIAPGYKISKVNMLIFLTDMQPDKIFKYQIHIYDIIFIRRAQDTGGR